jgi:hypothetical protein
MASYLQRSTRCSSVPAQLVEEVVDDAQLAGADHLVVEITADGGTLIG